MDILLDEKVRQVVDMCWDEMEKKIQVEYKIPSLKKTKTNCINSTMWCLAFRSHQWSQTCMLKWMKDREGKCFDLSTAWRWDMVEKHIW